MASGVTVVAAAGNNGFNAANLRPASYNEVITVSALADTDGKAGGTGGALCYSWGSYDRDDTFADFSNYGGDVDLIAPGKCIWSTLPGNRYGYVSGTSMAAPHVTGAVALYKASRPLATPAEVRAALRAAGTLDWNTATDPDSIHEPLLDVSHLVALGDFTLDATPGTSHAALVGAAGASLELPVSLVRAEDFPAAVNLAVSATAPLAAALGSDTLAGQDQVATTMRVTVPEGTPSGTYTGHRHRRRRDPPARLRVPRGRGQRPSECDGAGARAAPGVEPGRRSEFGRDVGRGIGHGRHDRPLRPSLARGRQHRQPDDAVRRGPPGEPQDEARPHLRPAPPRA